MTHYTVVILITISLWLSVSGKDGTSSHNLVTENCHPLHNDDGTDDEVLTARDVDEIKGRIIQLISEDETGCTFPIRKGFIAVFVRLAWHDAGTWDRESQTGGPHARMRFPENPESPLNELENRGLERYIEYLDMIHDFYADKITRADLWALAAVTAIEYGSGLVIPYRWGRTDESDPAVGYTGRLPSPYKAHDTTGGPDLDGLHSHLLDVFTRLEFKDPLKALVVLTGAHNLGGPRPFQSEMTPAHKLEPTPWTPIGKHFRNIFYSELLWSQWWDTEAERANTHLLLHANNRTIMFYSDFSLLSTQEAVDLVHHYATDLHAWYRDFAELFSFLLERGYPEGIMREVEASYLWETGEWGFCNKPCGGGWQRRDVKCVKYPSFEPAEFEDCENSRDSPKNIPAAVRECSTQLCTEHIWYYTVWGNCSATCGGGYHTREVYCMNNMTSRIVDNELCEGLTSPHAVGLCNTDDCGKWEIVIGTQGECDLPCENSWLMKAFPLTEEMWTGEAPAEFRCMKDFDGNLREVSDELCNENRKPEYVKCINRFCDQTLPHWRAEKWSSCSTNCDDPCSAECQEGTQIREVGCFVGTHNQDVDGGIQVADGVCERPPEWSIQPIPNEVISPIKVPEMPKQYGTKPTTIRTCNQNSRCDEVDTPSEDQGIKEYGYLGDFATHGEMVGSYALSEKTALDNWVLFFVFLCVATVIGGIAIYCKRLRNVHLKDTAAKLGPVEQLSERRDNEMLSYQTFDPHTK